MKGMNYYKYAITMILPLLFIFPYGKYRCSHKSFKDPLETNLFYGLDGWSATHFFWFMVMGYIYPETIVLSMSIGILWELFEHYYGKNRPGWLGGYGDCNNLATDQVSGNWWYGKWTDIICNMIGFIMGEFLRTGKLFKFSSNIF